MEALLALAPAPSTAYAIYEKVQAKSLIDGWSRQQRRLEKAMTKTPREKAKRLTPPPETVRRCVELNLVEVEHHIREQVADLADACASRLHHRLRMQHT